MTKKSYTPYEIANMIFAVFFIAIMFWLFSGPNEKAPPTPIAETTKPVEVVKKLGLDREYYDVVKGFDNYGIEFESSLLANGDYRRIGSSNKLLANVVLEVIGETSNIEQATIMATQSKNKVSNDGTAECLKLLLDNTLPYWFDRYDWFKENFNQLTKARKDGESITVIGDIKVALHYYKDLSMMSLSIAHKDRK